MTAINLALRNLYGHVIWGNSLGVEKRLIYRTGFNLRGFVREVPIQECSGSVQQVVDETSAPAADPHADSGQPAAAAQHLQKKQLRLF